MGQENNRNILMLIRFAFSLPLIIAIIFTLGNWSYLQTQTNRIWFFAICVMAIATVFLISRVRLPESFSTYQHTEHYVKEAREHRDVFTIPVVCPICKTSLKLDEVRWQDPHTLLCQECSSEISVTIT